MTYRGTLPIRNAPPIGPCSRPMPGALQCMVVPGGGAVSYERGTPARDRMAVPTRPRPSPSPCGDEGVWRWRCLCDEWPRSRGQRHSVAKAMPFRWRCYEWRPNGGADATRQRPSPLPRGTPCILRFGLRVNCWSFMRTDSFQMTWKSFCSNAN